MTTYTRNSDLLKRKGVEDTRRNCGSFALETDEWFVPYDSSGEDKYTCDTRDELMIRMFEAGKSIKKILNKILKKDTIYISKLCPWVEFTTLKRTKPTDKLIAYRIGIHFEDGILDTDFHFRIRENGVWYDKPGSNPVRKITKKTPWDLSDCKNYYNSKIVYFRFRKK